LTVDLGAGLRLEFVCKATSPGEPDTIGGITSHIKSRDTVEVSSRDPSALYTYRNMANRSTWLPMDRLLGN
ncbi:Hypothetical predicted protein, partial [Pelobates cultripes]